MRIGNLIELVKTSYNRGVASDDSRLSSRYIYTKILAARNRLITQQARKNQKISQWSYQTLPCVELVKAPMHECPCLPPAGCTIYKMKFALPQLLTDLDIHLIQSVTTVDGSVEFNEVTWTEKKNNKGNRYTASKADYYIRNNYLYITQKTGPTLITITGLFDDPLKVYEYPSKCDDCEVNDCYDCESPLDKDFPIDGDMVNVLIQMAEQEIAQGFQQGITDSRNDAAEEQTQ